MNIRGWVKATCPYCNFEMQVKLSMVNAGLNLVDCDTHQGTQDAHGCGETYVISVLPVKPMVKSFRIAEC